MYNIENQYVIKHSKGSSSEMSNKIAEVANNVVQEEYPNIYSNLYSYIQSGKFPVVWIGGNLSFDFRKYKIEDRKKLNKKIKHAIVKEFKDVYPDLFIDLKFNISFEPSKFDFFVQNEKFTSCSSVSAFYPFSEREQLTDSIHDYINNHIISKGICGNDFKIIIDKSDIHINQIFFRDSEEDYNTYKNLIENFLETLILEYHKDHNIIINNERYILNNIRNNQFGSMIFHNNSSISGSGNDYYGFISPERPANNDKNRGLCRYHPNMVLFEKAKRRAMEEYEKTENPTVVTLTGFMGDDINSFQENINQTK